MYNIANVNKSFENANDDETTWLFSKHIMNVDYFRNLMFFLLQFSHKIVNTWVIKFYDQNKHPPFGTFWNSFESITLYVYKKIQS